MSIKVVLYGNLRKLADDLDGTETIGTVNIESQGITNISDIFERLGIKKKDVSHIFLNRDYSAPERKIKDGDRVALFPRDMALLYKWYFNKKK
ncbi:MAG: MoaD/ThiS family protein [Candidatus Saliniplasma sp.]